MKTCDILIVGSGYSGSLMALVLSRLGYQVVVVDHCTHPRFAIGESSTPIADTLLKKLAEQYDLPEVQPLAGYATTKTAYPSVLVGKKRGFSYFQHHPDCDFSPGDHHQNEMLVAASSSDEFADSHWLRSDVDHFLVELFEKYGIQFYDQTKIHCLDKNLDGWKVSLLQNHDDIHLQARYLIDASGGQGAILELLGIQRDNSPMKTCTSGLYAHFEGVERWSQPKFSLSNEHPFLCDDAAVHHLLQESWMWQLRFSNGLQSCGFSIPFSGNADAPQNNQAIKSNACSSELLDSFFQRIENYPSLKKQFQSATAVTPVNKAFYRPRLQYLSSTGSGRGWSALPNTVGFVDPLHSKGIAHSLSGITRLAAIFRNHQPGDTLDDQVQKLGQQIQQEILLIDRLVALCYQCLGNFTLFRNATFWYFAAATIFERNDFGGDDCQLGFLVQEGGSFEQALNSYGKRVDQLLAGLARPGDVSEKAVAELNDYGRELLQPFDHVGLLSPQIPNMYPFTAAPKS